MAGLNGLTPTLYQVLQIMPMGVAVTPTQINDHIGKGNYASKHILYLKILGYDFDTNKDGRSVVSYTLIKVPDNHQVLINNASGKGSKTKTAKAPKIAKAPKASVAVDQLLTVGAAHINVNKVKPPKKVAAKKSVADIKAANLAKLKAVGQRFKADQVQVLTEAPASTSFSIDNDWDSVEGLDLKNLIG